MENNSDNYPEAWKFFIEHARNIMDEPSINHLGSYRIPKPDFSGDFIYSDCPGKLFVKFRLQFYAINKNAHSLYGKIQYIVQTF